ncbi:winged helix-turn-helix domain-containing protein [Natrinema gelatinilyticum]|uniref:winged helix-turn-helix domain-containing protein n=1 Tax=Natrinema gelatinilyticum TaxID=2961571 RepID=UPI0020C3992F|nr:helix-turn-helix domain-containing protein [Natrinema gelatinilyticum]
MSEKPSIWLWINIRAALQRGSNMTTPLMTPKSANHPARTRAVNRETVHGHAPIIRVLFTPGRMSLDMQRAIGNETRFRILHFLTETGAHSAKELEQGLDLPSNALHYHLDALIDVGLVENRKRKTPDTEGLYSYYQVTSLGEGILEHGVRELMGEEWNLLDAYND